MVLSCLWRKLSGSDLFVKKPQWFLLVEGRENVKVGGEGRGRKGQEELEKTLLMVVAGGD